MHIHARVLQIIEYSKAETVTEPILQTGPPIKVSMPQPLSVTATTVTLEWAATTSCVAGAGTAPCVVQKYQVECVSCMCVCIYIRVFVCMSVWQTLRAVLYITITWHILCTAMMCAYVNIHARIFSSI